MDYKTALAVLWFCGLTIFLGSVYFGRHPENAVSTTMLYILGVLSAMIALCEILELFA